MFNLSSEGCAERLVRVIKTPKNSIMRNIPPPPVYLPRAKPCLSPQLLSAPVAHQLRLFPEGLMPLGFKAHKLGRGPQNPKEALQEGAGVPWTAVGL